MAKFETNQNLVNSGFRQLSGDTLTLCGNTLINSTGRFKYTSDQHSTYTARSVVDASYVTGQTAIISHIGLNQQIIYRDVSGLTGATHFIYNKTLPSLSFGSNNYANAINSAIIGGNNNIITSGNTGSTIFGGSNIILSAATYSNTVIVPNLAIWYTPQGSGNLLGWDIVTKKVYLTSSSGGSTGGTSNITGATNGLNIVNKNVVLGGTLLNTTLIDGAQTLQININNLNITGTTAINFTSSAVTLQTTPNIGILTDSLLVWNLIDKKIKIVGSDNFLNKIYSKTIITGSTGLTSGSSYIILISGTSITLTLPTAPFADQAFKIKDMCGNALLSNIIIDAGIGRTIDGSQCALINTDYGAVELMLGASCKWFTISFIN